MTAGRFRAGQRAVEASSESMQPARLSHVDARHGLAARVGRNKGREGALVGERPVERRRTERHAGVAPARLRGILLTDVEQHRSPLLALRAVGLKEGAPVEGGPCWWVGGRYGRASAAVAHPTVRRPPLARSPTQTSPPPVRPSASPSRSSSARAPVGAQARARQAASSSREVGMRRDIASGCLCCCSGEESAAESVCLAAAATGVKLRGAEAARKAQRRQRHGGGVARLVRPAQVPAALLPLCPLSSALSHACCRHERPHSFRAARRRSPPPPAAARLPPARHPLSTCCCSPTPRPAPRRAVLGVRRRLLAELGTERRRFRRLLCLFPVHHLPLRRCRQQQRPSRRPGGGGSNRARASGCARRPRMQRLSIRVGQCRQRRLGARLSLL